MKRKVIPISRPKVTIKPRLPANVPVINEFLGSQPIVLKDDFVRLVAESYGGMFSDKIYDLTIYYNVLTTIFGVDTLEICYVGPDQFERVIKRVSIEEKLSAREQELVDYVRGFIKYAQDRDWMRGSEKRKKRNLEKLLKFFIQDGFNRHKGQWRIETLTEKFPEIKIFKNKLYVYSFSAFQDSKKVIPKKDSDSIMRLPIPLSRDFKEINQLSKQDLGESDLDGYDAFQRECFRTVFRKRDPLSIFMKANLLKAPFSNTQATPLDDFEKKLLASFMRVAKISSHNLILRNNTSIGVHSDVSSVVVLSNFKKLKVECVFRGSENIDPKMLKIKLIKSNKKTDEVFAVTSCDEPWRKSEKYLKLPRLENLGSFPSQFAHRGNPSQKEVFITRDQLYDNSLKLFSCNRVVSEDKEINSGYSQVDLSLRSDTIVVFDSSGKVNLNRDVITNVNSGEYSVNSTVKLNNEKYDKSYPDFPISEERMNSIRLFSFCISNKENNFPVNVLKISNIPGSVRISSVFCQPEIGTSGFELPFTRGANEIIHGDPLPGVRYSYEIDFIDSHGKKYDNFLKTKIRTLNAAPRNIVLENLGQWTSSNKSRYLRVGLAKSLLNNYATNISKNLDQIFKSRDREFYTEQFKEKLNKNLQNIGKSFELFASYYSKETGELIESRYLSPRPPEDGGGNDDNLYFLIPTDILMEDLVISYNLIITNPIDLVTVQEDFEGVDSMKTFLKDTSKFFSTVGRAAGVIPARTKDPQTGDILYQTLSRFSADSKLARLVCSGGIYEALNSGGSKRHKVMRLSAVYFPDDGEFLLKWNATGMRTQWTKPVHIDFFIITAIIEDIEIPISAYPFLGFTNYKMRTFSMLGACTRVRFKIYPVYNDFKVDISGAAASDIYDIADMRLEGNKVI